MFGVSRRGIAGYTVKNAISSAQWSNEFRMSAIFSYLFEESLDYLQGLTIHPSLIHIHIKEIVYDKNAYDFNAREYEKFLRYKTSFDFGICRTSIQNWIMLFFQILYCNFHVTFFAKCS